MQSQYAWIVSLQGEHAVFTWANCAKKYIRDTYTADGELHLPPPGHIGVIRYKVNPKAGHRVVWDIIQVEEFLKS